MLVENIKTEFAQYKNQADKSDFFALREQAFVEFEKTGLPTTKHEEWKYTNLRSIANGSFQSTCVSNHKAESLLEKSFLKDLTANRLVFVNGSFHSELSSIIETDANIIISTISKGRAIATENPTPMARINPFRKNPAFLPTASKASAVRFANSIPPATISAKQIEIGQRKGNSGGNVSSIKASSDARKVTTETKTIDSPMAIRICLD